MSTSVSKASARAASPRPAHARRAVFHHPHRNGPRSRIPRWEHRRRQMDRLCQPANRGAAGTVELSAAGRGQHRGRARPAGDQQDPGLLRRVGARGGQYFPAPGRTQAVNTMVDTGTHRGRGRASLTIASSVGVVNTLVCGASVAFAAGDWGLPPPAAAAVGGAVAVMVGWLIFRYQHDRFVAAVGEDDLTDRQSIGHRSAVAHWRPATPSSGQPPG